MRTALIILALLSMAATEPQSPRAMDAMAKHDESVAKAAATYWKACAVADRAMLEELQISQKIAEKQGDKAEADAVSQVIDDVTRRVQAEMAAASTRAAAAAPTAYSFEARPPSGPAKPITISALKANGANWVGARVTLADVSFESVDNSQVVGIPGVGPAESAGGYQGVVVDPNTMDMSANTVRPRQPGQSPADWIGVEVSDASDRQVYRTFDRIFAPAKALGPDVAAFKPHQRVVIVGTVIQMRTEGEYGIVCQQITAQK